ncbi:MAG: apolipoprotein N-acyltransferase [Actinobacteria bacterium]|nr:apolipoprotein N-acyltransferase [Actinomycetota bacterium]
MLFSSFAPFTLWYLAPVAIALFIKTLESDSLRIRMARTIAFAISFFAPLLHWTSSYVGSAPWILLVLLQCLLLLPIAFVNTQKKNSLLTFLSMWVLIEALRTRFPFGGFGWGRVAFSQAQAPYAPLAAIGGAPLLTFTSCLVGVCLVLLGRKQFLKAFTVGITITLATVASSFTLTSISGESVRILAVQGGVPELGMDFNARATSVFYNHLNATKKYLHTHEGKPDLILWPENSVDVDPFLFSKVNQDLTDLVDEFNIPIIIGAVTQGSLGLRNESILWLPHHGADTRYVKRHLTPFGEYMPWRSLAQRISPYATNVIDFIPGEDPLLHRVGRAKIGSIICFELLDDTLGREITSGSNLLFVQTNSATFGLSAESAQQMQITQIRAIEHQRNIASVSTSGMSAFINKQGMVSQETNLNSVATIESTLALHAGKSFSDNYGAYIEIFLILLPLFLRIRKRLLIS